MRLIVSCAAAIVLGVVLLAACNSNDQTKKSVVKLDNLSTPTPPDGAPRITVTELKEAVDKGAAVIIDTRGHEVYAQEHIKGSLDFPLGDIATRAKDLPGDKLIVAYCS